MKGTKRDRDKLRKRVKAALDGRTQRELETELELSSGTLTRVFGGRRQVDAELLTAMAQGLGMEPIALVKGTKFAELLQEPESELPPEPGAEPEPEPAPEPEPEPEPGPTVVDEALPPPVAAAPEPPDTDRTIPVPDPEPAPPPPPGPAASQGPAGDAPRRRRGIRRRLLRFISSFFGG